MQNTNFEALISPHGTPLETCYLNTSLGASCRQGDVPVIGVDARSVDDIRTAVKFAVKHNLRVVIKNTGSGIWYILEKLQFLTVHE